MRSFGLLLVLSLLAAAACFVWSARPPAVLWALFTALSLLGLTAIYVISPLGLPDYLDSNADRVVSAVVIGGAALAPLLAAELLGARRTDAAPEESS